MKKMYIAIFVTDLRVGGLEKYSIKFASDMVSAGHSVSVFKFNAMSQDFFSPSNNLVKVVGIFRKFPRPHKGLFKNVFNLNFVSFLKDLLSFRRSFSKNRFDITISFGAGNGVLTYLLLLGMKIPQVVSERTHPSPKIYRPSFLARWFRPRIYRMGVTCVVQDFAHRDWIRENWGFEPAVIPNHFQASEIHWRYQGQTQLLFVGRDAPEKRLDLLLSAWRHLVSETDYSLVVISDIDESLVKLAKYDLRRVTFKKFKCSLTEEMLNSLCLISTSSVEGYPNVVAEALELGVPVLATNSCESIRRWSNENALLDLGEGDSYEIAIRIREFLQAEGLIDRLSNMTSSRAALPSWRTVYPLWMRLIENRKDSTFHSKKFN